MRTEIKTATIIVKLIIIILFFIINLHLTSSIFLKSSIINFSCFKIFVGKLVKEKKRQSVLSSVCFNIVPVKHSVKKLEITNEQTSPLGYVQRKSFPPKTLSNLKSIFLVIRPVSSTSSLQIAFLGSSLSSIDPAGNPQSPLSLRLISRISLFFQYNYRNTSHN